MEKYKNILKFYFSDYFKWLPLVIGLFLTVNLLALFCGVEKWIILWMMIIWIAALLPSLGYLIFYIKSMSDLKNNRIIRKEIEIIKIEYDEKRTFEGKGRTIIGKVKYKLIDENGYSYYFSGNSDIKVHTELINIPAKKVEIEYLENSKLLLRIRVDYPEYTVKEMREKKDDIKVFNRIFEVYIK